MKSLALGAQGVDSATTAANLTLELAELGYRATVVNDAALIVPAGGFDQGVEIVAGTGAIAVGKDRADNMLAAGGWGCVIGDEGGAAALVREATRAALRAHDEGKPTMACSARCFAPLTSPMPSGWPARSTTSRRRKTGQPAARRSSPPRMRARRSLRGQLRRALTRSPRSSTSLSQEARLERMWWRPAASSSTRNDCSAPLHNRCKQVIRN